MNRTVAEHLKTWLEAGLLDPQQAQRILAFEAQGGGDGSGRRLASTLALAFGVLLVGSGLLLFVAANWEHLSPALRFLTVLALVGGLHLGAALAAERAPKLVVPLHGMGTLALGAGIFLAGQIFNLQEHWPGGVLLWALGAWLGWALLRDWVQGLLAALLTPAWIIGEWVDSARFNAPGADTVLALGCVLLALSYLGARLPGREGALRRALVWVGGLALFPATLALILVRDRWAASIGPGLTGDPRLLAGYAVALGGPLVLAWFLRRRAAWINLVAALWAMALVGVAGAGTELGVHVLCALGALGLVLWGLREAARERVNLGVAGFAITLGAFYFSSIMDKLGRSLGLIGLGLLFLLGGWQLERLRRRLNALIGRGEA